MVDGMQIDVRLVRENLGESQARFGERFGVDQATVHRWEKNGLPAHGTARAAVENFIKSIDDAPAPSKGEAA